jgi:hypothetical protein
MTSQIGQHPALQVFIFEEHRPPGVIRTVIAQTVSESIRIVKTAISILIEWGIGVRRALFIGG